MLAAGCEQMVTAAEESLVQLLPPDGPVDHAWIHKAEMLISGWSFCLHSENRGDSFGGSNRIMLVIAVCMVNALYKSHSNLQIKVQLSPFLIKHHVMQHMGLVEIWLHVLLTMAVHGDECSVSHLAV